MQTTRALSRERTRDSLRRSAEQTFVRAGVSSASIEQIAQQAGFTRGAFYANYASKLELLIDVLATRQVEDIGAWHEALQAADDVGQLIDDLSARFAAQRDGRADGPLLAAELELEANRNPAFLPHYVAYLDQLFDAIGHFLETLLRRCGKSPPDDLGRHVAAVRAFSLTLGSDAVSATRIGRAIDGRRAMRAFLRSIIDSAPDAPRAAP